MARQGKDRDLVEARRLFGLCREQLHGAAWFAGLCSRYREAIGQTGEMMQNLGVAAACGHCAGIGPGSCCFAGVEKNYDVVLLLINLLLGNPPIQAGEIEGKCRFVGQVGCQLLARHYYCQCFLCDDLKTALGGAGVQCLNDTVARELAVGWELEQALQLWLRSDAVRGRGGA